jgi:uracil phosphoribosyltransferase
MYQLNTSKSVLEFVKRIRQLRATIRIVVVASVVQAQSVTKGNAFYKKFTHHTGYPTFYMVALRLSENKYSGRGRTDTGNRLFNTTH